MASTAVDGEPASLADLVEHHGTRGRSVAIVGAHGGAGTTTAALSLAIGTERGVCLIDADIAGGDLAERLALPERMSDAGLAGSPISAQSAFAELSRRVSFGVFLALCPRPDLAWLIRDGLARDVTRMAMRHTALAVIDAGRPLGPTCEPVVDADVVVIVAHSHRPDSAARARRRLVRLGVDERRLIDCPSTPTMLERIAGRVRGSNRSIDVLRSDDLILLVEGRLAMLGPRERQ